MTPSQPPIKFVHRFIYLSYGREEEHHVIYIYLQNTYSELKFISDNIAEFKKTTSYKGWSWTTSTSQAILWTI
jgi:hypothetical protein